MDTCFATLPPPDPTAQGWRWSPANRNEVLSKIFSKKTLVYNLTSPKSAQIKQGVSTVVSVLLSQQQKREEGRAVEPWALRYGASCLIEGKLSQILPPWAGSIFYCVRDIKSIETSTVFNVSVDLILSQPGVKVHYRMFFKMLYVECEIKPVRIHSGLPLTVMQDSVSCHSSSPTSLYGVCVHHVKAQRDTF